MAPTDPWQALIDSGQVIPAEQPGVINMDAIQPSTSALTRLPGELVAAMRASKIGSVSALCADASAIKSGLLKEAESLAASTPTWMRTRQSAG